MVTQAALAATVGYDPVGVAPDGGIVREGARPALALLGVALLAAARTETTLAPGVWPTLAERATHAGALVGLALLAGTVGAALDRSPGRAATTTRLAIGWAWAAVGTGALLPLADVATDGLATLLASLAALCAALALAAVVAARSGGGSMVVALPLLALAVEGGRALPSLVPSSAPGPTIVLLTLDTARADAFDLCGDGPGRSPAMAAIAARARVACHAYATNPLTGPSHASMLTGSTSPEHGTWRNGQDLAGDVTTVAERLSAAGYATAAVVSASVLDASLGFDQGFARFDSTVDGRLARAWPLFRDLGFTHRPGSAHARAGDATLDLLEGRIPARGAFVWVHLYDLHWPYTPTTTAAVAEGVTDLRALPESIRQAVPTPGAPPDADTIARGRRLYYAQARDLDAVLARLDAMLPDGAALVVAGDHGESLDEHGYWFAHGRLVHGDATWVPLLVAAPGVAPARLAPARSTVDVAATILDLAGLPTDLGTSRSLLRDEAGPAWSFAWREATSLALQGPPDPALGPVAGVARREGDASLVWWDPGPELRAVGVDPLDVGPFVRPDDAALAPLRAPVERARRAPAPVVRDDQAAALEALGYLDR